MKSIAYTRKAKIQYLIAVLLFGTSITLVIMGHLGIGALIAGAAIALAYGTAQTNGHFTHFGKTDSK